ncbi:MAG: DUF86 domain-containing protein [Sedimentisphaerales bacterium]|nr:DUF86 domain-containing protein [Sedimentisphaerales bacterium]
MKTDQMYLEHIQEAISKIEDYTAGGRVVFDAEPMRQDAVIRNFEIIGEAVKRLSDQAKQKTPQIDWRDVAGLRDVLIHNYMGVDLDEVWNIVENNLPSLKAAVEGMLNG